MFASKISANCLARRLAPLTVLGLMAALSPKLPGNPPEPVKLSTVAPAADLVASVRPLADEAAAAVASEQAFTDQKDALKRSANVLVVLAVGLGLHDEDHDLKKHAPALHQAALALAAAGDLAAAQTAQRALRAALDGQATNGQANDGPELSWQPAATMSELMKHVTVANNRARRGLRRLDSKKEEIARDAAVLATIAQAVAFDTSFAASDEDADKWYRLSGEMRDAAGELNARARAADKTGTEAAAARLVKSCDACHATFNVDVQ